MKSGHYRPASDSCPILGAGWDAYKKYMYAFMTFAIILNTTQHTFIRYQTGVQRAFYCLLSFTESIRYGDLHETLLMSTGTCNLFLPYKVLVVLFKYECQYKITQRGKTCTSKIVRDQTVTCLLFQRVIYGYICCINSNNSQENPF